MTQMEDTIDKELVSNDSDDDFDFTARKRHGKQALRIESEDSEDDDDKNSTADRIADTIETVRGSNTDDSSHESKESSDDDGNVSATTQRKKRRTKTKKSDGQKDHDELKSKINALCDDESSSEESDDNVQNESRSEFVEPKKMQRAPQRMSAKQAEEQMKVIQSESQRLVRECPLSVPYHKPKQHSLKEFLNRRTINRPVPMALTKKAAATIKMSKEELEQYAKSLEDRNKESQEFYRSDSDHSNDDGDGIEAKDDEQPNNRSEKMDTQSAEPLVTSIEEPTASTSNVSENLLENANDPSNEPVNIAVDELASLTNVIPDDCNAETEEIPNGDNLSADIVAPPTVVTEVEKPMKETIEIDYDFGEEETAAPKTLKDLLPLYSTAKPSLKGSANGIINLDVDEVRPIKSGGDELMERFIRHAALKPNRSAKEVSILSTTNGVIELNNVKIESEEQNCIYSKPRKVAFKLKEELSARIAAKRKEELMRKQMASAATIPSENIDSEDDVPECNEEKLEANDGNDKQDCDSDVEEVNENDNDDEMDDVNDEIKETDVEEEEEDQVDEEDEIESELEDGSAQKTKQRRRIILMDNSDDDDDGRGEILLSEEGKSENSAKTEELNTTSISLDESLLVPDDAVDKTMSQISKNQSRADQMIDSCGRIVPEEIETDNNMSTLFTQNADSTSVSDLLDLCSGSFATQATNAKFVENDIEPSYNAEVNNVSESEFSDDEIGSSKKSKQRKKVNISDDEEQVDEDKDTNLIHDDESKTSDDHQNENGIDNNSDLSDEEEAIERIVEYDSEENEIEVPVGQKKKISDFFENEAELSESEWGSADEDERNLDRFEMELGDEDEFDQDKLVSELDRIHRRRMLDQDAREVKIIQDTHFEDEEESGVGRQRQFKWKHMENSLNLDESKKTDEVDDNAGAKSDEENEEMWRRMRHERNNILQETKAQNETVNESKLIAVTKTKKRISIVKATASLNTSVTKDLSFLISKVKEERKHRSSLLIRDEQTLANLAKMTTDEDNVPSINTNSKHFLFNVISSDQGKPPGKRKLDDTEEAESENKIRKTTKKPKKSTLSVLDKLM